MVEVGKKILQEMTSEGEDWDKLLSIEHTERWKEWKSDMRLLEAIQVPRCYTSETFGETVSRSLHCFSDASSIAYGIASYLRSVNVNGDICVSLVTGKSRVAPIKKSITIPRLELVAGTVSAKVAAHVKEELDISDLPVTFWTDSAIVLGYLANETKRFRTFVANRVSMINNYSDKLQWRHVPSEDNPADLASRGLSPKCKEKVEMWFNGPSFLLKDESEWPESISASVDDNDVELKNTKITVNRVTISAHADIITTLELRISSWYKLVRVLAQVMRFIQVTRSLAKKSKDVIPESDISTVQSGCAYRSLTMADMKAARKKVLQLTQEKYFSCELEALKKSEKDASCAQVKKRSTLSKLDPYINNEGLICVGGRLKNSNEDSMKKYPVVIPKGSAVATLLVREAHHAVAHCAGCATLNRLREEGYWVVGSHSLIRSIINKCRTCRELRGKMAEQKMANLPEERVVESPPFTHCGADIFGPFLIKEGRKELKRYGCIFTCMASRAVHLERTTKLDTDTLILAVRRFIDRRGEVSSIRTDNGTNFVGAENELKKCLEEIDHEKVREYLLSKNCDWIVWKKNPPEASHMGGVWERQIRSIRAILSALMKDHPAILTDESLETLFTEAEAIINSRPLTVDSGCGPDDLRPLSPMQILTFKSDVVFPPPGNFQRNDLYCRRQWRRVQYLADQFWYRWKKEYLFSLQVRQKWTRKSRNLMVGDVVLVKDSEIFTKRNGWPLACVEEVYPSADNLVRKVKLRVAHKQADKTTSLIRPISKLVLLVNADDNCDIPSTTTTTAVTAVSTATKTTSTSTIATTTTTTSAPTTAVSV